MYADIFTNGATTPISTAQLAELLQQENKTLTTDELAMAEASKLVETRAIQEKEAAYKNTYSTAERTFLTKHIGGYMAYVKANAQTCRNHKMLY